MHTANARTEGNKIVLEGPVANGNTWPWFQDIRGAPYKPIPNTFRRLTLDLGSKRRRSTRRCCSTRPSRASLASTSASSRCRIATSFVQYADARFDSGELLGRTDGNCIGRFDLHTSTLTPFFPGPARALHEPVFIPASATSAEGEGYLLAAGDNLDAVDHRALRHRRDDDGELARVTLPFRSTPQVHGTWANAATLPLPQ